MDINELKQKIKDIENKNKKGGTKKVWKPKATGIYTVRLLSLPVKDPADIGEEYRYHFNIGSEFRVWCPRNRGEDCAICEADARLRAWNDENGKEKPEGTRRAQFAVARKIEAGPKYYVPAILRGKETDAYEGPFWWEVSENTRSNLLKVCANDDWNRVHKDGGTFRILTSPKEGLDITIDFKKAGEAGNAKTFNVTDISERKIFTPIFEKLDPSVLALPELDDDELRVKTPKQVEAIFNAWFEEPKAGDGSGEGGIERASNSAEKLEKGAAVEDTVAKLKALMDKKKSPAAEKQQA